MPSSKTLSAATAATPYTHSPIGELKEALQLLGKAIDLAGKKDIRLLALEDRDLEPLWKEIAEI